MGEDVRTEGLMTDDEIVACAVAAGRPWLGPLPTVDVDDEGDLLLATRRGQRSLFVRELVDDEGQPASALAHLVQKLSGEKDHVSVLLADASLQRASYELSSLHYLGDDSWITETVADEGVHSFTLSPASANVDYLTAVADAALEDGPQGSLDEDASGPQYVVLVARQGQTVRLAALRRGGVQFGAVESDGAVRLGSTVSDREISGRQVVERLLESA